MIVKFRIQVIIKSLHKKYSAIYIAFQIKEFKYFKEIYPRAGIIRFYAWIHKTKNIHMISMKPNGGNLKS